MDIKSLEDLPNEIIIQNVIVHLSSKDVLSFGMARNDRFMDLTENADYDPSDLVNCLVQIKGVFGDSCQKCCRKSVMVMACRYHIKIPRSITNIYANKERKGILSEMI